MDESDARLLGAMPPIKINEINGLWTFLQQIDWSEPWFSGLGIFHLVCILLTFLTRNTGAIQAAYFGLLMMMVVCAEHINKWAAENWSLFARQQYFDSNGLFISIVFSVPLLINCLVIVVSWLWDVGMLISNVKQIKIRTKQKAMSIVAEKQKERHSDIEEDSTEEKKEK